MDGCAQLADAVLLFSRRGWMAGEEAHEEADHEEQEDQHAEQHVDFERAEFAGVGIGNARHHEIAAGQLRDDPESPAANAARQGQGDSGARSWVASSGFMWRLFSQKAGFPSKDCPFVPLRKSDYIRAMRFPPSFLDDIRARVSISSVIGRKVAWDRRKQSGQGRLLGLLPVPWREVAVASMPMIAKGGTIASAARCRATSSPTSWRRKACRFPEAVAQLAQEAGLPMPAYSEADAKREENALKPL